MMLTPPANSPPTCPTCDAARRAWTADGATRYACGATLDMIQQGFHPPPITSTSTPSEKEAHARSIALYKKHRTEKNLGRDPLL